MLIVISHPATIPAEAAIINDLFEAGMARFHVRKPGMEREALVRLLKGINPVFYPRIALHQHHEVAADFDIQRLHFTEEKRRQMKEPSLMSLSGAGWTLSTSIHGPEALPCCLDYAFFGPVFDSISKPGYRGRFNEGDGAGHRPRSHEGDGIALGVPLVAIGGISVLTINKALRRGFSGAAVLGAIWSEPAEAVARFRELREVAQP